MSCPRQWFADGTLTFPVIAMRINSEMTYLAWFLLGIDEESEEMVQDVFLGLSDSDLPPKIDR